MSLLSLLHSGYGKRMLFVSVFWSCSVIPVFAVYAFAPTVLQALHLKGAWASFGSVAITLLFVVGCFVATRLINTVGRRSMLIHSFLWSGLALLGLGLFCDGSEMLVLVLFGAYAVFIGGAQVLQLVYPNELFPPKSGRPRWAWGPRCRASAQPLERGRSPSRCRALVSATRCSRRPG